ncbi:MAG TPA: hypothetical protein VD836_11575 [Solirubrobacteraceae bacterium]|nr:hypothetical protein [Solirubrobacteraceae bacterium]
MSDHTSDQEAVSAPVTAPGVDSATPLTGMAGLTAMGNQAFGAYANLGSVLSHAILSDPEKATRAPWVSLQGETEQAVANTVALGRRGDDFRARGRTADDDALVQDGLAGAVAARRGVSRFPPGAQPRMPSAPQPGTQPPGPTAQPGAGEQSIDWAKWFDEYGLNAIRTPLEIARVWPGVGMWTGLASDAINGYTDLDTIKDEDAPVLKTVLVIRNVLNAINNVIGHINYVGTLVQDASLASVIGAWINPIVATINMTLKDIKLLLDLAMGVIDIGIWAAAEQRLRNAGPKGKKAWGDMVAGYKANMIGDLATLLVDCWDAATATEGQGEVAKQITLSAKGVLELVRRYGMTFLNWLQGVFNVWGSKATESAPAPAADAGGAPAPGTPAAAPGTPPVARMLAGGAVARAENASGGIARQAASAALVMELQQVKAGYVVGDTLLEGAAAAIPALIKHQSEQLKIVTGGRDPFQFFRDAGANAIKGLAERAGALEGSAVFATNGKQKADALREGCDTALATVDEMKLPPIDVPGADLLLGPVRSGLDDAKARARAPIQGLKTNADEVAEFLQIFAEGAKEQIGWCRQQLEELSAGLAKCNSFEDIMNLMLAKIQSALGTGTNVNLDDIRAWWKGLGPQIDEAIVWAQGLANPAGATPPPAAAAGAGAAAPPPADRGGGGGGSAAAAGAGPATAGGAPAAGGAGAAPAPAATPGAPPGGANPAAGARAAADAAAATASGAAQAGTPPAAVAGAAGAAPAPPAGAGAAGGAAAESSASAAGGAGAAGAAAAAAATNGAAGGAAGAAGADTAPGAPGDAGAAAAAPAHEKVPA